MKFLIGLLICTLVAVSWHDIHLQHKIENLEDEQEKEKPTRK